MVLTPITGCVSTAMEKWRAQCLTVLLAAMELVFGAIVVNGCTTTKQQKEKGIVGNVWCIAEITNKK